MIRNLLILLCVGLLGHVRAAGRTSPPAGCISVKADGSADFKTVQDAVDSLSTTSSADQCIFIYPGTYSEQVTIDKRSAQLTIYGSTTDTSSFSSNSVTVTAGHSQDEGISNDETATVRAHSTGLRIYNINMVNTRGKGSQAVALSASNADQQSFYGVKLIGFQDTLLADAGNQLYVNSYIEGATDFIFGQTARAWFQNVQINPVAAGYITANGRDSDDNESFYVFHKATVTGSASAGTVYLGRPWRDYARVVFQESALSDVINSAGWKIWNTGDERTDHVFFMEYENTGAGASGTRASFAGTLSSPETIADILGSSYTSWVDTSYL